MIKRLFQSLLGWHSKTPAEKYIASYRLSSLAASAISLCPMPIALLLQLSGSDKQQDGWHSYGATYAELFRSLKYRRVKLLEIGIGGYNQEIGGRSLLAWQAFFPLGSIIACDIVAKFELGGRRRRVYQVDQSSAADLTKLCEAEGPFDIIIDDGSHRSQHQIFTFQHLFDSLKDGGIYVVEDVATSFWPGVVANVTWDGARMFEPGFRETCYGYFLELSKYLNYAEFVDYRGAVPALLKYARNIKWIRFEHNLVIVRKGNNTERSHFVAPDAVPVPETSLT